MKILVSLDALADKSHREDLKSQSFDEYHEAQINDEPNVVFCRLLQQLGEAYEIVVYTTMPENYRLQVEDWLYQNDFPVEEIYMREFGDYSKNHEVAIDIINAVEDVEMVIDNDIRVIDTCRANEIFVLEAAQ